MSKLQQTILKTLVYHDLFDYPLTQKEIWKFLLLSLKLKVKSEKLQFKIKNYLTTLQKSRRIEKKESFYFLPGREKIVGLRKKREKFSGEKIKLAQKAVQLIKPIPWVKMIGITGALAMDNSEDNDDIDFLIITSPNRLWLVRLLTVIILEIMGWHRRVDAKDIKNKICLNMFLDESRLQLTKGKQNLFVAHEICQMKPIFSRKQTYEKFIKANLWVKRYLPNALEIKKLRNWKLREEKNSFPPNISISPACAEALAGRQYLNIFDFLENLAYQLQIRYMKVRRTREVISPHFAFFHPQNRSREIMLKYQQCLNFLKNTKKL